MTTKEETQETNNYLPLIFGILIGMIIGASIAIISYDSKLAQAYNDNENCSIHFKTCYKALYDTVDACDKIQEQRDECMALIEKFINRSIVY